jgi:hypothetical protein
MTLADGTHLAAIYTSIGAMVGAGGVVAAAIYVIRHGPSAFKDWRTKNRLAIQREVALQEAEMRGWAGVGGGNLNVPRVRLVTDAKELERPVEALMVPADRGTHGPTCYAVVAAVDGDTGGTAVRRLITEGLITRPPNATEQLVLRRAYPQILAASQDAAP